jgi:hypothetical protein
MRPVVVAVAITGSVPRKKDSPAVPITAAEQVESTHEAYEAGATLVHIHVRNDDETPSSDPERFAAVKEGVEKCCPGMIVQFSTGGRGRDPSRRGSALHLRPDMASLSTGSVNFPTIVYENSAAFVEGLAAKMKEYGVLPEIEIFDLSHLHGAKRLAEAGLIGEPTSLGHRVPGVDDHVDQRGFELGEVRPHPRRITRHHGPDLDPGPDNGPQHVGHTANPLGSVEGLHLGADHYFTTRILAVPRRATTVAAMSLP